MKNVHSTKNIKFLKEIINSDFPILNPQNSKGASNISSINIQNSNIKTLDLLNLNKRLKQFLNSLIELKKNAGYITILVSDPYISALLISLVKEANLIENIFIYNSTMYVRRLPSHHMLIVLDTTFFINNNFFPRMFEKKINIIQVFNVVKEYRTQGTYKVYNEINDLKKIIFLFLLIKIGLLSFCKKKTLKQHRNNSAKI